MRRFVAIYMLVAAFLVAGAAQSAVTPMKDPRKCESSAVYCSKTAAVVALRKHMAAASGIEVWNTAIRCTSTSSTLLAWSCAFNGRTGTVTFRPLSTGWHTLVRVAA